MPPSAAKLQQEPQPPRQVPPAQATPEPPIGVAQAAAGGAAAAVAGTAAAGLGLAAAVKGFNFLYSAGPLVAVGQLLDEILERMTLFNFRIRAAEDAYIVRTYRPRIGQQATLDLIAEENARRAEFDRGVLARVRRDAGKALALPTPGERVDALQRLFDREGRYATQRSEAMRVRADALADRVVLREVSPVGAYWRLGEAEKHTPDCLAMAGRVWPWVVLDAFHPPTHTGCKCSLWSRDEAVAAGWPRAGDIQPLDVAMRRAAAARLLLHEDAVEGMRLAFVETGAGSPAKFDRALWASATGRQ